MKLEKLRGIEQTVYQPAEDSALLAEAARDGVDDTDFVLEVGTGSGYVADALAETGAHVIGSDLNPHACRQARARGLEVVRADLLAPFQPETFDVVAFNPPYLPTDPDEEGDDWMEQALSGGESGRRVIAPFLADVGRVLVPDGVVFLLVSTLTGIDVVLEQAAQAGFHGQQVLEESYPFETLVVLELRRQ